MRWTDLDLDEKLWKLPRTKSGAGDEKPLSALALDLIARARREGPKGSERVFQSDREGVLTGFGHAYAHAKELSPGVPDWRPHDLRRTAATGMAKLGVDRFVIERALGHTDRSVTGIYDRYARLPECRKALDLWARHLRRVLARKGAK